MDRSGDNENSRSNKRKDDDSNSRLVEDNVGRKRKRDNSSASSYPQHGGEATTQTTALHQADRDEGREQQTTSQKRVMEPSKQQLLVEIRELRKELRDREREIEALRGELEREKQRWLKRDNESQSNEDTTIANDGIITSAAAPGSSVKERESNEFDASTDEDMIQLSSTSSMDRHHHRHLNGADNADADEGSEGHISSVESRMNGNDYNDKEIKAVGGENEKENKVADSCNTTTSRSGETNRGQQLRANDNAGDDEEEQNKVVQIPQTERQKEESDDEVVGDDGTLAFCCQSCTCNNSTTTVKLYSCVHSCDGTSSSMVGNMNLYHKGCCHNEKGDENLFKSPMQISREKGFAMEQKEKRGQEISLQQMKQKYEHAKKEAAQVANEEYLAAEDSKIYSCPVYETYVEKFQQRKGTHESPLRVLELFSGIGSGTLALKRLRIPLHTIVHCEHDPLANEVCKFNHQRDGIRHVYIDTFEEIYGERNEANHDKVAKLVADHGPFDLVLAGAPCSSYSGLNANRNASCANAQYLPNVDYDKIAACYGGLEPIRLDAKDFSPCKRDRFYWCNIPKYNDEKYTRVASQVSVDYDGILDPGYGIVESLWHDVNEPLIVKANTFLASLTKIDDDRMLKYSTGDIGRTKIKLEHYSVAERERMMGLPNRYVSKPLQVLFDEITKNAILQPETNANGKTYRNFMDRTFWHLRKKLKLQHYPKPDEPYFEIGIATPIENKQKIAFFKEEQYCKHLIGMGFSICVVEALLAPIVDLFATNDMLKTYEGCDYSFPWEPYLSYHRDLQSTN